MRVVRIGESRVPCADPVAVIHVELSRLAEGEVLELVASSVSIEAVRDALRMLGDSIVVLGERFEGDVYKVRVAPGRSKVGVGRVERTT